MTFIRAGLKGIAALALLWATVVLLGGFVNSIRKRDFWVLTIIVLLQAAGAFDAMGDARFAFFDTWLDSLVWKQRSVDSWSRLPVRERLHKSVSKKTDAALIWIFFPVAYSALTAPCSCIVWSAFRLARQDYGIGDGESSKSNLKPALNLFYSVSLVHGAMCLLCMSFDMYGDELLAATVGRQHGISVEVLDGYVRETKRMCLNNPASTKNWNLITYGVGLLDSESPEDYTSGGRVLTMLIDQGIPSSIKQLLIRSPRQRIQKLIGTLAWRSPAEREMRWLAARIVEHLAGHLNLAHFPGALECISSLFDTSYHNNGDQEAVHLHSVIGRSNQRKRLGCLHNMVNVPRKVLSNALVEWVRKEDGEQGEPENGGTLEQDKQERETGERTDEDLVLPGLRILENLADDKHNCTLIYKTKDLISKLVVPVSSKELIEDCKSSAAWTKVVDGSLKVVNRLMGSSGGTGKKMCSLIANNSNAVKNLEAVLHMDMKSNSGIIVLHMQALDVLTQLSLHHPASTSAEQLAKRALHIFLDTDWVEDYLKDEKRKIDQPTTTQHVNGTRQEEKMAQKAAEARVEKKMREAQQTASRLKEKAGEALAMLSTDAEAIKSFTKCTDAHVGRLTELLNTNAIKCKISATDTVEIEISIGCHISAAVILKHLCKYVKAPDLWEVLQRLFHVQHAEPFPLGSHIEQCGERRLQAELLSLIAAIRANNDINLPEILLSQTPPDTMEDFVGGLKKVVEDNMYATPACLAIQKLTCEMVTGLLQDDANVKVIDKQNIIGTLLKASKTMDRLESSMHFAGVRHDCHGVPLKPLSSVLAKRAEDLLIQRKRALGINIAPASVPLL